MDFFHSDSAFDTSRARRVLGWGPKIHLNEGVARTLDAYRKAGLV
jgi:nucleoside-diphosphate-sugar epimerase